MILRKLIGCLVLLCSCAVFAQEHVTVTAPPDSLKLDTAFYKKYICVRGLPICSSVNVPDSVFDVAYKTFEAVTHMLPDDVMASLVSHGARVTIMGKDEQTCDVPEHSYLKNDPKTDWNKRARGLGGSLWLPMSSCAEENLMAYPNDRYWREDITIHEFAHAIHNVGISPCYPDFNKELKAALKAAKAAGKWNNTYAQGNIEEYFAEGVQDWFNVNTEVDEQDGDGIHNRVNTREELKNYDPTLYNILARFFPDTKEHISRHKYQNKYMDKFSLSSTSWQDDRVKVSLQTTEGEIVVALYNETPLHRDNFLKKVKAGVYDGRTFNRVIAGFVIQCGEEQAEDIIPAEINYPKFFHRRGVLAMGRCTADPMHELKSADEQFYIAWGCVNDEKRMHRADSLMNAWSYGRVKMDEKVREYYKSNPGIPSLDGSYTIFGEVVTGMDIVERIQSTKTDEHDRPLKDITIKSTEIIYPKK